MTAEIDHIWEASDASETASTRLSLPVDVKSPDVYVKLIRAGKARRCVLGPDVTLFGEGNRIERVVLLLEGSIRLSRDLTSGENTTVSVLGPGTFVGLAYAVSDAIAPISAITLVRCEVALFRRARLMDLIGSPTCSRDIAILQAKEYCRQMSLQHSLCEASLRARLSGVCAYFAACDLGDHVTPFRNAPLQHRQLADLLRVSPAHFSRVLRQMERDGFVSRKGGWIRLINAMPLPAQGEK